MNKMIRTLLLFFTLVAAVSGFGTTTNAEQAWKAKELNAAALFQDTDGTILVKNLKTDRVYGFNLERAEERFTPESTFKVPNALIGLETGAVSDEYDVKRWDGEEREFEVWNRDHTLGSAMRDSAIWYYQEMARDIGAERMQSQLDAIGYGNRDISGGIDRFWLDSSLRISAWEQISFLEGLAKEELPLEEQTMKTVKRMMIDLEEDDFTIHGKTGTRLSDYGLGWYIGFVESDNNTWVFAANADAGGSQAKNIVLECLEELRIIPESE